MPVLSIISHLTLVNAYVFSTCVTVLCIKGLEAVAAVWSSILHDVALPAKGGLTLVATEMLHVPVPALRLSALISKDDLITGTAAGFQPLGMVPATVDLAILVEVYEVHQ